MNKIQTLRAAIEAAIPDIRRNPDRLVVFAEQGKIACTSRTNLSFEYRYQVELLFTSLSGHVDCAIVAVMAWVRDNEPLIFDRWRNEGEGIAFEAELVSEKEVDLAIRLPLTERVKVTQQLNGQIDIQHLGEPPHPDPMGPAPLLKTVFAQYSSHEVWAEEITEPVTGSETPPAHLSPAAKVAAATFETTLTGTSVTVLFAEHGIYNPVLSIVLDPSGAEVFVATVIDGTTVHLSSNVALDGHTLILLGTQP